MYYFFTVAPDHRSAKKSAAAIIRAQHHQWDSQDVDTYIESDQWIRPFSDLVSNNFKGMIEKDFSVTFWIGHSNTKEFGEFTIDQFVNKFADEFQQQFGENTNSKLMVKHIYLISCEVGLTGSKQVVAAQAIADKLHQNGFREVIVHAVVSPPVEKMQMLVSVVTVSRREQEASGEVSAVLCTNEQGDELDRLKIEIQDIEERKKPTQEERNIAQAEIRRLEYQREQIKNSAKKILLTHNIKLELDRKQNSFYPKAPEKRPQKNFEQESVLVEIEKIKFQYSLKNKQDKIDQLKMVADAVAAGDEHTWREIFSVEVEKIKPRGAFRSCKVYQHKLYRQLVDLLNKNNNHCLADALSLSSSELVAPAARAAEPATNTVQNISITSQAPDRIELSLAAGRGQGMAMSPLSLLSLKQWTPHFFKLGASKQVVEHAAAKRLNALANHLDSEAKNAWCHANLKRYKAAKLRKLAFIINNASVTDGLDETWLLAVKASLLDRKLTSGVLTHRTKDLLQNIIHDYDPPSEKNRLINRLV